MNTSERPAPDRNGPDRAGPERQPRKWGSLPDDIRNRLVVLTEVLGIVELGDPIDIGDALHAAAWVHTGKIPE